jgi:hypothetical protein
MKDVIKLMNAILVKNWYAIVEAKIVDALKM